MPPPPWRLLNPTRVLYYVKDEDALRLLANTEANIKNLRDGRTAKGILMRSFKVPIERSFSATAIGADEKYTEKTRTNPTAKQPQ